MTINLDAIALPSNLTWADRDDWQPVAQTLRLARDGTPVIYHAPILAGRPITLTSTESSGWMTRAVLDQLQALAATPGSTHNLSIGGQSFTVLWRHHEPPAISAEALIARNLHDAGDYFRVTLKFMTL